MCAPRSLVAERQRPERSEEVPLGQTAFPTLERKAANVIPRSGATWESVKRERVATQTFGLFAMTGEHTGSPLRRF